MKIHFPLPWGGEFNLERAPLSEDQAAQRCGVRIAIIAALFFLGLVYILKH